jgi:RHH-type proline utilization regulon transcriptional repressor/proline dehydrogenase/delta 1-pyrroline-5-carboxylate dehydrogenase
VQEDVADTMLTMIRGAMEALTIGDPRLPTTDVGPVIDVDAKTALDTHVAELRTSGRIVAQLPLSTNQGSFVAPVIAELPSLAELKDEHFGPILHVIRWKSGELDKVIDQINATGFGLTLGVQSRIDTVAEHVSRRARVGNLYINRNQIGAVVESQPFGGEGLSGTGPKAGGPHYVARFATERVTCTDTTAAGGNATLMAAID